MSNQLPQIGYNPKGDVYMAIARDDGDVTVYLRWDPNSAEAISNLLHTAALGARKFRGEKHKECKAQMAKSHNGEDSPAPGPTPSAMGSHLGEASGS